MMKPQLSNIQYLSKEILLSLVAASGLMGRFPAILLSPPSLLPDVRGSADPMDSVLHGMSTLECTGVSPRGTSLPTVETKR